MSPRELRCVYASGLTIQDPDLLSSLALFYDKIWLPHPYDLDPQATPLMNWPFKKLDDLDWEQKRYASWKESNKELFDAGALEVMPPPVTIGVDDPDDLAQQLRDELGILYPHFSSSQVFSGRIALAAHALFSKTDDPEFVLSRPDDTSTAHLRSVLATSLLEYKIPRLGKLSAEQILKLREEVAQYKQGFVDYLNQMVDDVEDRLIKTGGDDREAAMRTIERKIVPEFDEFLARELPERVKWWSGLVKRAAASTKSVISVVLLPWNIANYPGVVENSAGIVEHIADRAVQQAKNQHRAFQLIGKIADRAGN